MFKKFSVLIGLTETEIKVLLFIVLTLLTGFSYKTFFLENKDAETKSFDYSTEDSLFLSSNNEAEFQEDSTEEDKSVDYKQEVLDFNESNFSKSNDIQPPAEKSININSAKVEELILLPGIGEKTAERIIALRNKRGQIKTLNELLEVKGIGEAKFQNIKKYLFIE